MRYCGGDLNEKTEGHVRRGILTMHDCAGVGPLHSSFPIASVSWRRRRWRRRGYEQIADRLHATLHFYGPRDRIKKKRKKDGCPILPLVSTRTLPLLLHLVHTRSFTSSKTYFFSFVYTTFPTMPHRIYTI